MLRLQKGKVPQHQFVTESCGTGRALATKHRGSEREKKEGRERGSVCVCVCVAESMSCLLLHLHRLSAAAADKTDLLHFVVLVG